MEVESRIIPISTVRVAAYLAFALTTVKVGVAAVSGAVYSVNRVIDWAVLKLLHYSGAALGAVGGAAYGVFDAAVKHDLHAVVDDSQQGASVCARLAEERLGRPISTVAEAAAWAAATGVTGGAAAAAEAARLAAIASSTAQVMITGHVAPGAAADAGAAAQQLAEAHPPHTPVGDLGDMLLPGSGDLCDRALQYLITRWSIKSAEAEHDRVDARAEQVRRSDVEAERRQRKAQAALDLAPEAASAAPHGRGRHPTRRRRRSDASVHAPVLRGRHSHLLSGPDACPDAY